MRPCTGPSLALGLLVSALALGCKARGDTAPSTAPAPDAVAPHVAAEQPWEPDLIRDGVERYPLLRFAHRLKDVTLEIEDAGMRPSLREAMSRKGALVAVNGGFFDPRGNPIGLAVSAGRVLSPLAPGMSGGVFVVDGERGRLAETESFTMPEHLDFGVQCRPRLVVDGKVNIRSDDGKRAERTAICLRDGGTSIELVVVRSEDAAGPGGPSLLALARHLAALGCDGALNLDGGPSTGVAYWRDGQLHHLPPRGPIRHAVVVRARPDGE